MQSGATVYNCPVGLNLYRRHQSDCVGGHPNRSRSYQTDELRRGWKKCFCTIQAAGTLAGEFRRRSTDTHAWEDAHAVATAWEQTGSWSGAVAIAPTSTSGPPREERLEPQVPRITVIEAIRAYLAEHESPNGRNSAPNTVKKYRETLAQVQRFADAKGYTRLEQWTTADVLEFRATWLDCPLSGAKKLERIKSFFEFCLMNEWITKSPAAAVKPPKGAQRIKHKSPYTDDELQRIFGACGRLDSTAWGNRYGSGAWTGEDVSDFIAVSIYTGLRISDVATFNITRLQSNNCFLFMHKTKKELFTWLPDWLRDRLEQRAHKHGPNIFGGHVTEDINVVTDTWRRKIQKVFRLAGPFEEKPTPHRFRHTFVRILLQNDVDPKDVAELIGDTEEMVRKHYARWVPERQQRLTRILQEKLNSVPRPRVGGGPKLAVIAKRA